MKYAELQRLRAELESDLQAFRARARELVALEPRSGDPATQAQVAVAILALEKPLERDFSAFNVFLARTADVLDSTD